MNKCAPMAAMLLLFGLVAWFTVRSTTANNPQPADAIYDPDPNHLWNRLFVQFYRQHFADQMPAADKAGAGNRGEGRLLGPDVLDPPLGYHPRFLLDDSAFLRADTILDEFLSTNGAALIHDPVKRALLQHDLWAVLDVLANADQAAIAPRGSQEYLGSWHTTSVQEQHRAILEGKLARAIRSLALSRDEIEGLPDTWSAAITSGVFTSVLETNRYDFMPADLFLTNSGWLEVSPGPSLTKHIPGTLEHTLLVGGRSIFRTFVKVPGLDSTTALPAPGFYIPYGTQFLLLREMICLDDGGNMVPTHIIESFQYRTEIQVGGRERGFAREAELSRAFLFQGKQGGLRPISHGEPRLQLYDGLGHLRVDRQGNHGPLLPFPQNCGACHEFPLVMLSNAQSFSKPSRQASIEAVSRWKQNPGQLGTTLKTGK
jgi:hypothetical protein